MFFLKWQPRKRFLNGQKRLCDLIDEIAFNFPHEDILIVFAYQKTIHDNKKWQ